MSRHVSLWVAAVLFLSGGSTRAESLYDAQSFRAFTADRKAHRVGDVVTVHVFENSSASTTSDTSTQRNHGVSARAGTSAINGGRQIDGSIELGSAFDGGGVTQRANRLLATLTVTVQEVLPNGDLRLAGEQLLTVNQEQHKVKVEGRVRPHDVSADNVVLSTRIADAKVSYAGQGDLTNRHKRTWLRMLIEFLGF
ncbi:MAG TPA: flagellar basal body L-ring protein FlgH [Gemmatimonadaceae bacterium]|nr:flagellar basal body L-ring protein FlgH [Gemmatimonadaceae bacterium]